MALVPVGEVAAGNFLPTEKGSVQATQKTQPATKTDIGHLDSLLLRTF